MRRRYLVCDGAGARSGIAQSSIQRSTRKASLARFFGDFFLDIEAKLQDVALLYGLDLGELEADAKLKDLVLEHLGETPVLGDYFEWHGLQWVVADVVDWKVTKIGLRLPPEEELQEGAE